MNTEQVTNKKFFVIQRNDFLWYVGETQRTVVALDDAKNFGSVREALVWLATNHMHVNAKVDLRIVEYERIDRKDQWALTKERTNQCVVSTRFNKPKSNELYLTACGYWTPNLFGACVFSTSNDLILGLRDAAKTGTIIPNDTTTHHVEKKPATTEYQFVRAVE
jgi:hypothetical protein